jgi:hypothetical protein
LRETIIFFLVVSSSTALSLSKICGGNGEGSASDTRNAHGGVSVMNTTYI